MGDSLETNPEDETPDSSWNGRMYWGVMLSLGWLVYKLTAQPRYGIAVTFAKFAWNDFLTGCWWFRRHPSWIRGTSGLLLVWSRGAAKFSLSLWGAWFAWAIVATDEKALADDSYHRLSIVCLMSMSIWGVLGMTATLIAAISRTKLWIDDQLYDNRIANRFPPIPSDGNQAMWILFLSWLTGPMAIGSIVKYVIGSLPEGNLAIAYVVSLYTLVVVLFLVGKSVVADSAEESWPSTES